MGGGTNQNGLKKGKGIGCGIGRSGVCVESDAATGEGSGVIWCAGTLGAVSSGGEGSSIIAESSSGSFLVAGSVLAGAHKEHKHISAASVFGISFASQPRYSEKKRSPLSSGKTSIS